MVSIKVCLSSLLGRNSLFVTAYCEINEVETVTVEQYFLKVIFSFPGPCQDIFSVSKTIYSDFIGLEDLMVFMKNLLLSFLKCLLVDSHLS